ncbi:entericidin A/B family lipoprotein [Henriciella litoralis]|nr:entericidin A/B family lipoprotein [Henriciella litoralis]
MKKLVLVALTLFTLPILTACNTVEGFGEDVSTAGDALAREADEAKN